MSEPDQPTSSVDKTSSDDERVCFVVMAFGRTPEEQRWHKGWYELVIREAIIAAEYEPVLSAALDAPSAINDEIRTHLAFDDLVVVDLGGAKPGDPPNPNVMYELGIRHALNLPVVMMAWEGQTLPFDISNQRVMMQRRELIDVKTNKERLVKFIKEAEAGNYYKPMDAVGRVASVHSVEVEAGPDSMLGVLAKEVQRLGKRIERQKLGEPDLYIGVGKVKHSLFSGNASKKELYPHFVEAGGDSEHWSKLLLTNSTSGFSTLASAWEKQDKIDFVRYIGSRINGGRLNKRAILSLVNAYVEDQIGEG